MGTSPGTENFAVVCCKLYHAAQSASPAFLRFFFAHQMVAIKSALEWGMESGQVDCVLPPSSILILILGSLTGLKCLWRESTRDCNNESSRHPSSSSAQNHRQDQQSMQFRDVIDDDDYYDVIEEDNNCDVIDTGMITQQSCHVEYLLPQLRSAYCR